MAKIWTFPESKHHTLVVIRNKTLYFDNKKGAKLSEQIENLEKSPLWILPNEIPLDDILSVKFVKNKFNIDTTNINTDIRVNDPKKADEIFTAISNEAPHLKATVKRMSIIFSYFGIGIIIAIHLYISLIIWLIKVIKIGSGANHSYLQDEFGMFLGNIIYGVGSMGMISIVIISLIYILPTVYLFNRDIENRPFIKRLHRVSS